MHKYTKLHYIHACIHTHTHIYKYTSLRTRSMLLTYRHGKHMCLRHTDQNFILVGFQFLYEVFGRNPDYTPEEHPDMLIFLFRPPNM